jgi:hypothetical protein
LNDSFSHWIKLTFYFSYLPFGAIDVLAEGSDLCIGSLDKRMIQEVVASYFLICGLDNNWNIFILVNGWAIIL